MIHKSIKVPLYHQTLQIIICDDVEKEINEVNKKFYVNTDRFEFSGYSEATGKYHLILLNKKYLTDDAFAMSTIAHEALHITSFIMKRVGIKPDVNNDEAQAYLLSWIVEQVYEQFKQTL
jgi:hypothetical protein